MKSVIVFLSFLEGLILISIGNFWGRMLVYSVESRFWLDLIQNGGSMTMMKVYMKHINNLKDQWSIVSFIGYVQILITGVYLVYYIRNTKRCRNHKKQI